MRIFHWIQILNKAGHTYVAAFDMSVKKLSFKLFIYIFIDVSSLIADTSKFSHFLHLIPLFSECYTANGEDYRGFQNQTSLHGGKPCLFWNETFQHPYNTLKYPNGEGGLGRHNYCRWVPFLDLEVYKTNWPVCGIQYQNQGLG